MGSRRGVKNSALIESPDFVSSINRLSQIIGLDPRHKTSDRVGRGEGVAVTAAVLMRAH